MTLSTPVVFIIFNRPDLTEIVFRAISETKPRFLLVVADGPRSSEEAVLCKEARKIVEKVDWKCDLFKDFSDHNLGTGRRVASGLDWAFSLVDQAIILEDDCLPTSSFFSFCNELLARYADDNRIMHISGDNFQFGRNKTSYSYCFSKYPHCWGWATWKRAWNLFDFEIKSWPELKNANIIRFIFEDQNERIYWTGILDRVYEGAIDAWDYQWNYACWTHSGLSILPSSNLVSNLGFRPDATHTFGDSPFAEMPVDDIWEIKHPPLIVRNIDADAFTFDSFFGGKRFKYNQTLMGKFRNTVNFFRRALQNRITNALNRHK